jgi:hypothetical protein
MAKKACILTILMCLAAAGLYADFSYEQTTKITGGAMASMMKVASVFSKGAGQPVRATVMVQGDRMAHATPDSSTIIDLGKETITTVNFREKTYSVLTFAQMAQIMEQLSKKTAQQSGGKAEMNFKASVKETGQTRQISGLNTREVVLTLQMEGTDKESGNKGSMTVTSDMWLAKDIPGYAEVRDFYQRMAQKVTWTPGSSAFSQGRGDMAKAFADLQKEAAKMEGVPVLQVVSMGAAGEGQPGQTDQQTAPRQEQRAAPSIGGSLSRLGGLGGFGRRKKEEPQQQEQPAAGAAPAAAPGVLMETTTETANFSTGAVDASKFQTPAGFRQVESDMLKAVR